MNRETAHALLFSGAILITGVVAAIIWALRNPRAGIVEPDEIDYRAILELCLPYLGKLVSAYTEWTPLSDRCGLYPDDVDASDPWQFCNFRVS